MSAASITLTASTSAGKTTQEVSRTRARARVHPSSSPCMFCGYSDDARAGVRVFSTPHGWYLCGRRARQPTLADVSRSATAAMLTVKRAQYMSVMYFECSNTHPGALSRSQWQCCRQLARARPPTAHKCTCPSKPSAGKAVPTLMLVLRVPSPTFASRRGSQAYRPPVVRFGPLPPQTRPSSSRLYYHMGDHMQDWH